MIAIDWHIFNAKFSGKQEKVFQWMCYLLFCLEHGKNLGISAFVNHAGIETEPIKIEDQVIGWQAKFYGNSLSAHKDELLKSLRDSKNDYPDLTKLIFYTNQEHTQGKKRNQPAQYQIEVEAKALSLGVEIEWRTNSYFESPSVCIENANITEYFFSLQDKGFIGLNKSFLEHKNQVLETIKASTDFNGKTIKIDRSAEINKLKSSLLSWCVILTGEGGIGKTAVVKELNSELEDKVPFIVVRALEFQNRTNENQFFNDLGSFSFADFIDGYKTFDKKIIVIDSAERLLEINDQTIFRSILEKLISEKWSVIFTTRPNYIEGLKYHLSYLKLSPEILKLSSISEVDLVKISNDNNFKLPSNRRFQEVLRNPFYLNEYLINYKSISNNTTLSNFYQLLWDIHIRGNTNHNGIGNKREIEFKRIATLRAHTGNYFLKLDHFDQGAVSSLAQDCIIERDSKTGRYFIAHDIYEEWALEKVIEDGFMDHSGNYGEFYSIIGNSLPVRKALRVWIGVRLKNDFTKIDGLIRFTLQNRHLGSYWLDEILTAVLLTDYAKIFFEVWKQELLQNDCELLKRINFILRIACKTIDTELMNQLGVNLDDTNFNQFFSKPIGLGWEVTISFIYENLTNFSVNNLVAFFPLLSDWNDKNKEGEVTVKASLIALEIYKKVVSEDKLYHYKDLQDKLFSTILVASLYLKQELSDLFEQTIKSNKFDHRLDHYEFINYILSSALTCYQLAQSNPELIRKLAQLAWLHRDDDNDRYSYRSMDMGSYFGISEHFDHAYFPASPFQTPIFQQLKFDTLETVKFIIEFMNIAVEKYSKSDLDEDISTIELHLPNDTINTQYISSRLWLMYRGTHVNSNLLTSMHMALEKFLLSLVEAGRINLVEQICLMILSKSQSASLTSVVTSIVLAKPENLFQIALILFKTKELFLYETSRYTRDLSQKNSLISLNSNFPSNCKDQIHNDELIKACDYPHRKLDLESIARNYQYFGSKELTQEVFEYRLDTIHKIIDTHYKAIEGQKDQNETWRIYLARMDRRVQEPNVEESLDGNLIINFNPKLDEDLKDKSEQSTKDYADWNKYTELWLWTRAKWEKDIEKSSKYDNYENSPETVIKKIKELVEELSNEGSPIKIFEAEYLIPAGSAVILRDFKGRLQKEEAQFLSENIFDRVKSIIINHYYYQYQYTEGSNEAILALPIIFSMNEEVAEAVKLTLLLLLLSSGGQILGTTIRTILFDFWNTSPASSKSLVIGYLLLKNSWDDLKKENSEKNYTQSEYLVDDLTQLDAKADSELIQSFITKYENDVQLILDNKVKLPDLKILDILDKKELYTIFALIPTETNDKDMLNLAQKIIERLGNFIFKKIDADEYDIRVAINDKFSQFILSRSVSEIREFIRPLIDKFEISKDTYKFFESLVRAEDYLEKKEQFWTIWEIFYPAILGIKPQISYYLDKTLRYYLFAENNWKSDTTSWYTIGISNASFFSKIVNEIGQNPNTLYSLAKILNNVGSLFLSENLGITWLSDIIENYGDTFESIPTNTVHYIEKVIKKYCYLNRPSIKTDPAIKNKVLIILNWLVERGSVDAYMLRDDLA